ncbi:HAMP domain-containing sensor histidine kinase [Paludicola sp. MB14-C6]|uniref:sensor histidine kinase n=1 Tax=Paludihabitans sp. MB14-C6 TaxID=3070656 RepID=UPI0027DBFC5D|nr:HAMP domain-containing sensor histidine kinase [Paludicola sp. MB14-C6]WMJ23809.1 HAMP domain-containing sensor histidine kinase [Paludicola sp. MB14-C6]
MQKSIFVRYFTVCASLVFISITILGALFLVFASRYFKEDKFKFLQSHVEQAAIIARFDLEEDGDLDVAKLQNTFRALSLTVDATIFMTDAQGHVMFCTEQGNCPHKDKQIPQSVLSTLSSDGKYSEMGKMGDFYSRHYYTVATQVSTRTNTRVAYVFTSMHASKQLQTFLNEMLKMFLFSSVAVLFLTFIIVYFVTLQMVKPLRQMSLAAQKFGKGELNTRLEVSSYDEMGQLAMALNNMAQSLSTQEIMRRSFIANISHELKTPMTSISGFVDGILDGTIPPEKQKYYLQIVSDETKRLSRLVKTMLNLSRIEAGEMKINKSRINIVDTICQTVFSFEQQIDKKHLTIKGLDHEKVMIEADPDLMHQVVYNLTENAVKFVDEGGFLEFSIYEIGDNTFVSVKNSGVGLTKEEMNKVFERFYKTDKSRGLDKNGVGLGLYIVRSIVNLHGGDITVNSVEGEYVEFVFSVPSKVPPKNPTTALQNKFKKS